MRLEDFRHLIELFAFSVVFTHEINVYFYLIGEEMGLPPTVKLWMRDVFEVSHVAYTGKAILGLSISD